MRTVAIPVGGEQLAGDVFEPEQNSGTAVVLGHGFSLTRADGLAGYAETFAAAGATALTFDYRGFGDSVSAVVPPQHFSRRHQQEDFGAALDHARRLPGITRVVAWGFSFGGGHAATLAARRQDLAAALLVCPFVDGFQRVLATPPATSAWIIPRAVASAAGRQVTIPVTAPVGQRGAMTLPGEHAGFLSSVPEGSRWRNEISPAIFLTVAAFRPVRLASRIRCPLWVGLGGRDISVGAAAVRKLAAGAPDATLHLIDGDHFEPVTPKLAPAVAAEQVSFLRSRGLL